MRVALFLKPFFFSLSFFIFAVCLGDKGGFGIGDHDSSTWHRLDRHVGGRPVCGYFVTDSFVLMAKSTGTEPTAPF